MSAPLDCPGAESLQALLASALSSDEEERCLRHLESCPACQEQLARIEAFGSDFLRLARQFGDPTAVPPDPTLTEVVQRLHEVKSPVRTAAVGPADLYFLRPADRPDLLGLLGEYEVQEVIGQGGMGVVLKAFEPALHRLVAIKVLAPAVAGSATARQRFTREARAAAAVCHEHIVAVHGVHEADGLPYIVMQYVSGESLQGRLDRTGPLEVIEIVRIGLQTAAALAAAHAQGLIHRDVKPANLLLENGVARVKITDFGLARMADDVGLTRDGVVAGTPEYMAPEQARGEPVDYRADLFSLGSVLYAMCTAAPPFRGASAVAVLRQVSDEAPAPIHSVNPNIPAWLEAVVERLMAKNPADRFGSAAEVAALLEGYLAHLCQPATVAAPQLPSSPPAVHPGRPLMEPRMTSRKLLLAAAAMLSVLGLLAAVGAGVLSFLEAPAADSGSSAAGTVPPGEAKPLEPENGLVCLLVNKKSGRCLSIGKPSAEPGAKVVQGPTPDQAGASERWTLLGAGNTFRLRNQSSRLVLEIGSANRAPGVQAIHWHEQATAPHQQWTFEPVENGYVLRAVHSQLVLGIAERSREAGGRAVQWEYIPDAPEECWELRPPYRQEYSWPPKGEPDNHQLLMRIGPDAEECVRFEPAGLRITLPAGHPGKRLSTGVATTFAVKGDFEITMSFNMLREPAPEDTGEGTGLFLGVDLDTPAYNRATLTRGVREGRQFTTWFQLTAEGADKPHTEELRSFPSTNVAGRLRLVRTGPNLAHYVAEGPGEDCVLLRQHRFGPEDVRAVRLGGETGGPRAALDVRVSDLRIRADSLPSLPAAAPTAPAPRSRKWLVAAGTAGLLITVSLMIPLLVWLRGRRGRRAEEALPAAAVPDRPAKTAAVASPISFPCPGCGKGLKAKANLAGKKVKCPQCHEAVFVPAVKAGPGRRADSFHDA
ncbi:MAG TPA: protein kinase [Gemmataceae bacterium]|nr:protein kinase [Gemmataceae bacterium]